VPKASSRKEKGRGFGGVVKRCPGRSPGGKRILVERTYVVTTNSVGLFLSLFVSLSATLRENGWTAICMKFSEKVWSDHGTT